LLQISWLIVLFGAKVSYATQNYEMHEFETETVHMSDYSKRIQALIITHKIIHNFKNGQKALTIIELTKELHIPIRMLKTIVQDLVRCRILAEVVSENSKAGAYQPAQSIEHFSVKYIMEQLDKLGEHYKVTKNSDVAKKFVEIHEQFFNSLESHPGNTLLKDI
jgi:membrane protein